MKEGDSNFAEEDGQQKLFGWTLLHHCFQEFMYKLLYFLESFRGYKALHDCPGVKGGETHLNVCKNDKPSSNFFISCLLVMSGPLDEAYTVNTFRYAPMQYEPWTITA